MLTFRNILAAGAICVSVAFGSLYFSNQTAQACLHPAKEFKYPIKAGAQKGLIFFADSRQELVIRPSYTVEGEGLKVKNDAVEGFTTVAWLVPVPNLPDTYKEVSESVFSELEDFTQAYQDARNRVAKDGGPARGSDWGPAEGGAEFLEQVQVGDYTIQPVKAKGELGAMELNGWLNDNGFGSVDADVMKYYQTNDYYWLAVKLHNPDGLPGSGEVKPLQIGFKADAPVYPMKINQGRGEFDLEMWLISDKEIDLEKTKAFGLKTVEQQDTDMLQEHRKTRFSSLPEDVREIAKDSEGLKKLKAGEIYCYRFFGVGMDDKVDLSKFESELTFEWMQAENEAPTPPAPGKPVD